MYFGKGIRSSFLDSNVGLQVVYLFVFGFVFNILLSDTLQQLRLKSSKKVCQWYTSTGIHWSILLGCVGWLAEN